MTQLHNKTVLVTGAAQRTGRDIALRCAQLGANVIIHYHKSHREAQALKFEIESLGANKAYCFQHDFADLTTISKLTNQIIDEVGELNILINNVGNYPFQPLIKTSDAELISLFNTNTFAPLILVRNLLPLLIKNTESHVINLGCAAVETRLAFNKTPLYHITKSALFDITKNLSNELSQYGVKVNMVSPGHLENSVDLPKNIKKEIPLGRAGNSADIFQAILYLIRDNSYSQGINIDVGGGYLNHL